MMRELPAPDHLNRPRDHAAIEVLPPTEWHCRHCDPQPRWSLPSSVQWLTGFDGFWFGRCRECGQKYTVDDIRPYKTA